MNTRSAEGGDAAQVRAGFGTVHKQRLHAAGVPLAACGDQWRRPVASRLVRRRPVLQQSGGNVGVAGLAYDEQHGQAVVGRRVWRGLLLEQAGHLLRFAPLSRHVNERHVQEAAAVLVERLLVALLCRPRRRHRGLDWRALQRRWHPPKAAAPAGGVAERPREPSSRPSRVGLSIRRDCGEERRRALPAAEASSLAPPSCGMTVRDTCALLLTLATVRAARPTQLENAFSKGDLLDVAVYVSATPRFVDFNSSDALIWAESSIPYDIVETRTANVKVPLTEHLLSNGTLYAHAFFTKQGASPDPKRSSFDRWATTGATIALVGHDAMLKPLGLYHLLTGEPAPWEAALRQGAADAVAAGRDGVYVSYWKPSLLLQLIVDEGRYEQGTMPHAYEMYLRHYRNVQGRRFRPLLYVNELTVPARPCRRDSPACTCIENRAVMCAHPARPPRSPRVPVCDCATFCRRARSTWPNGKTDQTVRPRGIPRPDARAPVHSRGRS